MQNKNVPCVSQYDSCKFVSTEGGGMCAASGRTRKGHPLTNYRHGLYCTRMYGDLSLLSTPPIPSWLLQRNTFTTPSSQPKTRAFEQPAASTTTQTGTAPALFFGNAHETEPTDSSNPVSFTYIRARRERHKNSFDSARLAQRHTTSERERYR